MIKFKKEITPKQYRYKNTNDFAEFAFYWEFCPYRAGTGVMGLVLTLSLEGFTDETLEDFKCYIDYPDLAKVMDKIIKDNGGYIFEDSPASAGFTFSQKDCLFNFIKSTTDILIKNGIVPFDGIDRVSAFPSLEYATNMLSYLFDEDCTLLEIEDYMKECAGVYGNYNEVVDFMELPCTSDQQFDVIKDADNSEFLKKWHEYLKNFNDTHETTSIPKSLREDLEKFKKGTTADVATEVSSDYNNFSSMWM